MRISYHNIIPLIIAVIILLKGVYFQSHDLEVVRMDRLKGRVVKGLTAICPSPHVFVDVQPVPFPTFKNKYVIINKRFTK